MTLEHVYIKYSNAITMIYPKDRLIAVVRGEKEENRSLREVGPSSSQSAANE